MIFAKKGVYFPELPIIYSVKSHECHKFSKRKWVWTKCTVAVGHTLPLYDLFDKVELRALHQPRFTATKKYQITSQDISWIWWYKKYKQTSGYQCGLN